MLANQINGRISRCLPLDGPTNNHSQRSIIATSHLKFDAVGTAKFEEAFPGVHPTADTSSHKGGHSLCAKCLRTSSATSNRAGAVPYANWRSLERELSHSIIPKITPCMDEVVICIGDGLYVSILIHVPWETAPHLVSRKHVHTQIR